MCFNFSELIFLPLLAPFTMFLVIRRPKAKKAETNLTHAKKTLENSATLAASRHSQNKEYSRLRSLHTGMYAYICMHSSSRCMQSRKSRDSSYDGVVRSWLFFAGPLDQLLAICLLESGYLYIKNHDLTSITQN